MVLESTIWSYVLFILMSNMHVLLMATNSYRVIQNVTLAIGAGIYEEILFRVILILWIMNILTVLKSSPQ